jgi:hypothetical protein
MMTEQFISGKNEELDVAQNTFGCKGGACGR